MNFFRSWTGIAMIAAVAVVLLLLGSAQLQRRLADVADPLTALDGGTAQGQDKTASASPAPSTPVPSTPAQSPATPAKDNPQSAPKTAEAKTTSPAVPAPAKPADTTEGDKTAVGAAAQDTTAAPPATPAPDAAAPAATDTPATKTASAAAPTGAETGPGAADTVHFEGIGFHINGLTCPKPDSEAGKRVSGTVAKFLASPGNVTCKWHDTATGRFGDCTADSSGTLQRLSDVLRSSGDCH